MYADRVTKSMRRCIDETNRRREIQIDHNERHGITPETIRKSVEEIEFATRLADARIAPATVAETTESYADEVNREEFVKILEKEMAEAAEALDFERAALLGEVGLAESSNSITYANAVELLVHRDMLAVEPGANHIDRRDPVLDGHDHR